MLRFEGSLLLDFLPILDHFILISLFIHFKRLLFCLALYLYANHWQNIDENTNYKVWKSYNFVESGFQCRKKYYYTKR